MEDFRRISRPTVTRGVGVPVPVAPASFHSFLYCTFPFDDAPIQERHGPLGARRSETVSLSDQRRIRFLAWSSVSVPYPSDGFMPLAYSEANTSLHGYCSLNSLNNSLRFEPLC